MLIKTYKGLVSVLKEKKGKCWNYNYVRFFKFTIFFSFISTWTLPELVHAVRNGDVIEEIYEVVAYEDYSNYLKEFLDILASYKIRHSKFNASSEEELQRMCDEINEKMNFQHEDLKLRPEILNENHDLKEFFKLWSNALLGNI